MHFMKEIFNGKSHLVSRHTGSTKMDAMILGMLRNNRIPGLAELSVSQTPGETVLHYSIEGTISLKELFSRPVSRHCLLKSFESILLAVEAAQEYLIDYTTLVFDAEYIFIDPKSYAASMICIPILDYNNGNTQKNFFKSILFGATFDNNEPCDHVAKIMNYLNTSTFETSAFRTLLSELDSEAFASSSPSPSQNSDPFFGLDLGGMTKPESQSTTFDFTADVSRGIESNPQSTFPSPSTEAPTVREESHPSPKRESSKGSPQDGSARSRRARARRETRTSIAEESPVVPSVDSSKVPQQEPPHTDAVASTDPFDLFSGFSAPDIKPKMNDAMRAADAILSALHLPEKEMPSPVAATPSFTPASTVPSESISAKPNSDDYLSDFTTPRTSSRRKHSTNESQASKALKEESRKIASEKPTVEEPMFDFSVPTKNTPQTEAQRIADALLSAALSAPLDAEKNASPDFVMQSPVTPKTKSIEESRKHTSSPDDRITAVSSATAFSREADLFDFGVPAAAPSRKTAAMLEAEAILDALDFNAPTEDRAEKPCATELQKPQEPTYPPSHSSKDSSEHASFKSSHVEKTVASDSSSRKGGFFSKLRKKEEIPQEQAPVAPPVTPYFVNDGETTVLNIAQQLTAPTTPYLLRASNQETVLLSKSVFRIGKDKSFVDYCITDNPAISRRHANFILRNGDIFVIDTNSTNHVFVNGSMIRSNTEVKLTHGDEIRLGNEDFMLYCAGVV